MTDSISGITFDPAERPGTNNPLTILSACTGETPAVLAEREDVVEAVEEALRKPRAELARLLEEKAFLAQVSRNGAEKAQEHLESSKAPWRTG